MTRMDALRAVLEFAGPLGPFQEPEERQRRETAWAGDAAAFDALLDLTAHPPSAAELHGLDPGDVEFALSRLLTIAGARDAARFLSRAAPLVGDLVARKTIIEVLGAIGSEEGLGLLAPLIDDAGLDEEEAARLACALGEIGGPRAVELLDRLDATRGDCAAVREEIAVAQNAARRRENR